MNSLLFSSVAFGFLFSLKQSSVTPKKILEDTFQIHACVAVFAATALPLSRYVPVQQETWGVWMIPVVFVVGSLAGKPPIFFLAVCGLSFRFLEPVSSAGAFQGVLSSAAIFSGFRLILLGFGERELFFRPLKNFSGIPMKFLQAFWAAVMVLVWALLFYFRFAESYSFF